MQHAWMISRNGLRVRPVFSIAETMFRLHVGDKDNLALQIHE
jgi:hypothetical protein